MRRDDLLDLNDVLQHPGRRIEVEVSTEMEDEGELDLVEPLNGELQALSTGNLLLITGTFKTRAVLECSKCGNATEIDVEFELDEQFPVEGTPSSLNHQDMAKIVAEEPYPLFEGNHLMVEALLRQDLLLALPLKPECPDGCQTPSIPKVLLSDGGHPEFSKLADLLKPGDEA